MAAPLIGTLERPILADNQISASCSYGRPDARYLKMYGPLNCRSGSTYGWLKAQQDAYGAHVWIQFSFADTKTISSVQTKSKSDGMMLSYKLSYSVDGTSWTFLTSEFSGGTRETFKDTRINPAFAARMVRLHPWSGQGVGGAIQVELTCVNDACVNDDANMRFARVLLQDIMQDEDFADCQLVSGTQRFPCHRAVMAASSPVWRAALTGGFRETHEATLHVDDAQPEIVKALRQYLYTRELDADQALPLLPLAHRYQLQQLFKDCLALVSGNLNKDNIVDVLSCLNTFMDDESTSEAWEKVMERVRSNPELLSASLRCVRRRT